MNMKTNIIKYNEMYTLELLENKSLFTQSVEDFKKHGCKGKVIFIANLVTINKILNENQ